MKNKTFLFERKYYRFRNVLKIEIILFSKDFVDIYLNSERKIKMQPCKK